MKPICFPSTYVSDSLAQAMTACFGEFIVYQPLAGKIPQHMCSWVDQGILHIRVPVTENQTDLEMIVKNYSSWAELHLDGSRLKPPFLKIWQDTIPYFNPSSSSQIAADIKKQVYGTPDLQAPEPSLTARLFLYFAQEFDRQNLEIAQDLERHHRQEAELIRQLKMGNDSLDAEFQKEAVPERDESADFMVLDRLEAWTRIFLKDTDIPGLFITHIPAVMQELLDKTPKAEMLLSIESIPIGTAMTAESDRWRQALVSDLAHIVENHWPPTHDRFSNQPVFPVAANAVSLRIYLAPDQNPRDFFSHCAQIQPSDSVAVHPGGRFKNTLIGLIEF